MKDHRIRTAAKMLFIYRNLTMKEISELLDGFVSRRVLSRWRLSDHWDEEKNKTNNSEKHYFGNIFRWIVSLHRAKN